MDYLEIHDHIIKIKNIVYVTYYKKDEKICFYLDNKDSKWVYNHNDLSELFDKVWDKLSKLKFIHIKNYILNEELIKCITFSSSDIKDPIIIISILNKTIQINYKKEDRVKIYKEIYTKLDYCKND